MHYGIYGTRGGLRGSLGRKAECYICHQWFLVCIYKVAIKLHMYLMTIAPWTVTPASWTVTPCTLNCDPCTLTCDPCRALQRRVRMSWGILLRTVKVETVKCEHATFPDSTPPGFQLLKLQLGLRQQYITTNFNPCHLLPPYLTACLLTLDFIRTVPKRYCNPMTGSHLDCSACPFWRDLSPNLPLLE